MNRAHIGVSVKDGVVPLSGHVSSYWEKYAAEKAAKRVHGVTAVANELDVELPDDSRRTDEDLAAAAVNALKSSISAPQGRIKVIVNKGWITLEGEVQWQYQKNAAENAVRYLTRVVGVSTRAKAELEWQLTHLGLFEAASYPFHVEGKVLPASVPGKRIEAGMTHVNDWFPSR